MHGPDFSGRWKFSPGDSTLQIRTPDAIEFLIDHQEPLFRLERTLVFVTRIVQGAEESTNLVRYHLEANGTVLVADESLSGPTLSYQNRWVFVRQ